MGLRNEDKLPKMPKGNRNRTKIPRHKGNMRQMSRNRQGMVSLLYYILKSWYERSNR